ncbi:sensor histidine kinase [Sedimentitalea todarodis]|uniref:histidine kinase n=1 Tax=Sedimentitalea todarodis TaxID=1631240 RepID=A0ABU3VHV2_9RHOB|nr:HAMP domain-containing sensor histidine kinase [Sedimentitalea todarodis]MDU9005764.1 HAMP domain-containing sensor histidine kinase [Sedimentitalea todarodis]
MRRFAFSLKARLAIGAGLLGLVALTTAAITVAGMNRVAERLDAALAAEHRIDRYAVLSTQVSSFIVVASEALQSGLRPEDRAGRLSNLSENIENTFKRLRSDHAQAVVDADRMGLNEQSRRATQSLGIARMEALFASTRSALLSEVTDRERLQGHIDTFAIGFDPLLNSVITGEMRIRNQVLAGITVLRERLIYVVTGVSVATLLLLALFYLGLVRPQFRRLDQLQAAARQIGEGQFDVALPEDRRDEIGQLFTETNRMAGALAARRSDVEDEWARLNDTIAARTEELRAANDALACTDENRRRFFADISHELRTPLTVILMEAQIGRKAAPDAEAAFETIESRALRLNRRIDDLLRIARSESGQLVLASQTFDLTKAALEAAENLDAEIKSAGMTLSGPDASQVMATGDANWVRQVIGGLIQNAIRHARSGGRIELDVRSDAGMGRVDVIDYGLGIAMEEQQAIFRRFAQGRSGAASEGFGIGLAFAKWVVEEQGGEITLTSPLPAGETGTKVTVGIPLGPD